MKEVEQQGSQVMPYEGRHDPNQQERHTKTLAIRVEETLHAQLRFIAQLRETSITDEIRQAIETRIASAQDDPEIIARAQQARDELEREAAARSAAIRDFGFEWGI
ncbi:hypothetical protein [Ferrimicrobium sp.]|uniref:hypothetical protein n=1 Tax=Ferrimicrobium sp. TaxID=2926050 RepID=UPI002613D35A|nr:hypothetical protein [Ferrimicrobium sp.]